MKTLFSRRYVQALLALAFSFTMAGIAWADVALAGMNDDPNVPGPYVMWGGTPMRHIMVPVGPRDN